MTPSPSRDFRQSLLTLILVVVVLYFGREFLVPIALAILFTFLLAPLVYRLERLRLGRIGSVIVATLFAFAIIGGIATIVAGQLVDLANDLPKYQGHLHEKIAALRPKGSGPFSRAADTLNDLTRDLTAPPAPATVPGRKDISVEVTKRAVEPPPVEVAVVKTPGNAWETVLKFVSPLLAPLATAALVVIFVIFMLLGREELRDRVIHLIGRGHLRVTTQALDEAASRVSRYLLAQGIVNLSYGFPIGIGLYFIGIPNAFLWGLLATVLRFIPYIGSWISAAFPIILSLATSDGWRMPLETIGLYIVVELVCANVVEPWLYGASTGLSPIAVLVAAAFWTWIWGIIGLLLATPITVCLVVLGKYIPSLSFFDVLLGDKPPISPEDRFYQRLLALDDDEVTSIAEGYLKRHGLVNTFDLLLIPAMRLADTDYHDGTLPEASRDRIYDIVRDVVADLPDEHVELAATVAEATPLAVCVPASDYGDEVVGLMLAKLLAQTGNLLAVAPSKLLASEMLEFVEQAPSRLLCVSVLPPSSTRHAVYVSKRLRERFEDARIVVGMWAEPDDSAKLERLRRVRVDGLVTSLQEMMNDLLATGRVATTPEPVEAGEPVAAVK